MTIEELHWLAGYLEGEGTFGCYKNGKFLVLQAKTTDLDAATTVAATLEARVYTDNMTAKSSRLGSKQSFTVSIRNHKAAEWMMRIYPLMHARRKEQILSALKLWKVTVRRQP